MLCMFARNDLIFSSVPFLLPFDQINVRKSTVKYKKIRFYSVQRKDSQWLLAIS